MSGVARQAWLFAGRVGRPHGLDGSFHVSLARGALLQAGATVRVGELEAQIVRRAGTEQAPIVRLEGTADRDAARALAGSELLVAIDGAPQLGPDEWWAEQLIGCTVWDAGRRVGTVTQLLELPSCECLVVEREAEAAADQLLVPMVRDAIRAVSVEELRIEIDLKYLGET